MKSSLSRWLVLCSSSFLVGPLGMAQTPTSEQGVSGSLPDRVLALEHKIALTEKKLAEAQKNIDALQSRKVQKTAFIGSVLKPVKDNSFQAVQGAEVRITSVGSPVLFAWTQGQANHANTDGHRQVRWGFRVMRRTEGVPVPVEAGRRLDEETLLHAPVLRGTKSAITTLKIDNAPPGVHTYYLEAVVYTTWPTHS